MRTEPYPLCIFCCVHIRIACCYEAITVLIYKPYCITVTYPILQLCAIHGIQSAFDEAMSYCRYHPSKGYWWHFKDQEERGRIHYYVMLMSFYKASLMLPYGTDKLY